MGLQFRAALLNSSGRPVSPRGDLRSLRLGVPKLPEHPKCVSDRSFQLLRCSHVIFKLFLVFKYGSE